MKRKLVSAAVLLSGILILFYPVISNYFAELQQNHVIVGLEEKVLETEKDILQREWERAREYPKGTSTYQEVLNLNGTGVMGYISIPKIDVNIPIYHSATEESLKKGVGHVEQTDLPVGGIGKHSVITGHRGLVNALLFTRLDEMEIGDSIYLSVLDKVLVYRVYQIRVVLPEAAEMLEPQAGKDILTLVTCTPYGENTHRLLVQGEREFLPENTEYEKEDDESIRNKIVFILIIILTGMLIVFYPMLTHRLFCKKVESQRKIYVQETKDSNYKLEQLYKELQRRNEAMHQEEQKNLNCQEAYESSGINLKIYGLKDNVIGFISIPKMKIELPIYLGANEENMKHGAVHLTNTSYPVGGKNTNCVIAAHRGYGKTAMFREIEKLKKGDTVYLRNFRERLKYRVCGIKIISPKEVELIKIQEGKDMITLLTCHPYGRNSSRYVVFCERV